MKKTLKQLKCGSWLAPGAVPGPIMFLLGRHVPTNTRQAGGGTFFGTNVLVELCKENQ